ncbi:MAG: hypothetical protein P4L36_09385 [Holophaga sp.]|nr:hypothetical protein [Holophaga sp.]
MFNQASNGLPPSPEVERFFHLLSEISRNQQLLLDETRSLRARVMELEARADGRNQGPAAGQEGRP